jgi:hypothetical protein
MEEGDQGRSPTLPIFSRATAIAWRNSTFRLAMVMNLDVDLNGLLFLLTKDEEQFRKHAQNKQADADYPELKATRFYSSSRGSNPRKLSSGIGSTFCKKR